MPKVVLYDIDGTLISDGTIGEKSRKLFFPETTNAVMQQQLAQGDHIIIASSVSKKEEIVAALKGANIPIDNIDINGKEETRALPGNNSADRKVKYAEAEAARLKLDGAVIIEDDIGIVPTNVATHILVPTNDPSKTPASDNYLLLATLPYSYLSKQVPPVVAKQNTNSNSIDMAALDTRYRELNNQFQAQQALLAELQEYEANPPPPRKGLTTIFHAPDNSKQVIAGIRKAITDNTLEPAKILKPNESKLTRIVDDFRNSVTAQMTTAKRPSATS